MNVLKFLCIVVVALGTGSAMAQVYPTPRGTGVNDYASILPDEAEARVTETIEQLKDDTGAQLTIVTLSTVTFYASNTSVADYATGLFNEWGIGDADKGDGILLVVFRDDSELRVELGEGYDAAAEARAQRVVNDLIIPQFKEGALSAGIEAGATGLADDVVRNVNAAKPAATGGGSGNALWYILGGIGALIAAVIGLRKRAAAKLAATPCASCGVAGQLSVERVTDLEPTETSKGKGRVLTTCGACNHVETKDFDISEKRPDDDDFEGGKSKGDGASGKW